MKTLREGVKELRGAKLKQQEKERFVKLEEQAEKLLRGRKMTFLELADALDCPPKETRKIVEALKLAGFHVEISEGSGTVETIKDFPPGGEYRIDPRHLQGKRYRFGFTTDNHLGSKYERLDVLNALFDRYEKEGISDVYQGGNIIEGIARFNRFDLQKGCDSFDGQVQYLIERWPKRKGITTRIIVGDDHEGWFAIREGINVGAYIERAFEAAGRSDLKYLGYLEADIRLAAPKGETWIRLQHAGGGSAYAISYTSQKLIESFQGGEKPAILLIGHYHKMDLCLPREVYCIQGGCTQDQTPFMRKNKIAAHVGGWICELEQAEDGHVVSLKAEFLKFYDRKFYQGEKYNRW